jgi:hypothetical protein
METAINIGSLSFWSIKVLSSIHSSSFKELAETRLLTQMFHRKNVMKVILRDADLLVVCFDRAWSRSV